MRPMGHLMDWRVWMLSAAASGVLPGTTPLWAQTSAPPTAPPAAPSRAASLRNALISVPQMRTPGSRGTPSSEEVQRQLRQLYERDGREMPPEFAQPITTTAPSAPVNGAGQPQVSYQQPPRQAAPAKPSMIGRLLGKSPKKAQVAQQPPAVAPKPAAAPAMAAPLPAPGVAESPEVLAARLAPAPAVRPTAPAATPAPAAESNPFGAPQFARPAAAPNMAANSAMPALPPGPPSSLDFPAFVPPVPAAGPAVAAQPSSPAGSAAPFPAELMPPSSAPATNSVASTAPAPAPAAAPAPAVATTSEPAAPADVVASRPTVAPLSQLPDLPPMPGTLESAKTDEASIAATEAPASAPETPTASDELDNAFPELSEGAADHSIVRKPVDAEEAAEDPFADLDENEADAEIAAAPMAPATEPSVASTPASTPAEDADLPRLDAAPGASSPTEVSTEAQATAELMAPDTAGTPALVATAIDGQPLDADGLPPAALDLSAPAAVAPPATVEITKPQTPAQIAEKMQQINERTTMRGLKGFCPVTLRDRQELQDASPQYSATYRGQKFHFASSDARDKFEQDPTRYAPAAYGADVVVLHRDQDVVEGTLDHAAWYKGRLYLFGTSESYDAFSSNPAQFASLEGIE